MKAWIYQDSHQVEKRGEAKASWYVGFIDPDGKRRCKSCGPGSFGKMQAEKFKKKVEAELLTGTYQSNAKKTWADFRHEYETKVLNALALRSQEEIKVAFKHFEDLVHPVKLISIKTPMIDEFRAKRRALKGKWKGETASPATVNKDLRHLRAALRKAHKWGYLPSVPDFAFEKEPKKLPTYVSGEHFAAIYRACDSATMPVGFAFSPADWWRGLVVTAYMTGWRISELLALTRDDLDLGAGTAITRAEDNKGKRDELVKLHAVVVEHLRKLASFDSHVFPWNHNKTTLYGQFADIQETAGIKLPCQAKHEHTRFCRVYGFHDFLNVMPFASNADRTNTVAAALTVMLRNFWPGAKPLVAVTSTKSHGGKETVIDFATGSAARSSVSYEAADWALQKAVVAALKENFEIGVLNIENVRLEGKCRHISSAFVERILTDPEPTFYSPGVGAPQRRANDLVLTMSTNYGSISEARGVREQARITLPACQWQSTAAALCTRNPRGTELARQVSRKASSHKLLEMRKSTFASWTCS